MYSTPIILLAFGLLATVAMARPGRRPAPGHGQTDLGSSSNHGHRPHGFQENQGDKGNVYRLPNTVRLPRLLTEKLGRPFPTYFAKKIFNGKYLLISPALLFKLKDVDNETDAGTTAFPGSSTQRPTRTTTESDLETTPEEIDEDSTTPTTEEVDEDSTTTPAEEIDEDSTTTEAPTPVEPSFKKRSFAIDNNEQLLFLDD